MQNYILQGLTLIPRVILKSVHKAKQNEEINCISCDIYYEFFNLHK